MRRFTRFLVASFFCALVGLMVPYGTSAHEHRAILDGQYEVTIGFIDEPAFVGEKNGLYLRVTKIGAEEAVASPPAGGESEEEEHDEGIPVEGLATTLQAEVIYGDQSMPLVLTPGFGEPGVYQSIFFPMAEGDYTFHIFGTIEGTAVDEMFTSSPEGFDSVQSRAPFEFPKP